MKLEAKIEWMIDDDVLKIEAGDTSIVLVDDDYIDANEDEIIDWIEDVLASRYGTELKCSKDELDDGDFIITNLNELIEDLSYEEFKAKRTFV